MRDTSAQNAVASNNFVWGRTTAVDSNGFVLDLDSFAMPEMSGFIFMVEDLMPSSEALKIFQANAKGSQSRIQELACMMFT